MKSTTVAWRTVIVCLVMAAVMLVGLGMCLKAGGENGPKYFEHVKDACEVLALIAASKSAVEALATGGGLFGAAKVLFTKAQPPAAQPAVIGEIK